MKRVFALLSLLLVVCCAVGQPWLRQHVSYRGHGFGFPILTGQVEQMSFGAMGDSLHTRLYSGLSQGLELSMAGRDPYALQLDSLVPEEEPVDWGRNKYVTFALHITTQEGRPVDSKEEYVPCLIQVDTRGQYPPQAVEGGIRGRGNSTWLWYPKKPYRLKFNESQKLLGISKNKDWVLLANYRDVSLSMNAFCSLAARHLGIPFTTPVRFAEVFLNGEYVGIYQVAEQVEAGGNRVDVESEKGLLLSLDVDDGPAQSPAATNNFWSAVFNMPVCVKYPKDPSAEQLAQVREDFAVLEQTIAQHDFEAAQSIMDVKSYAAMLQLQEFAYNVELLAPRSVYVFRDSTGRWGMGPAWDWDAGFDFQWSDMYTGHTYFASHEKTMLGSNPYESGSPGGFFTGLFGSAEFTRLYKEQWARAQDSLLLGPWAETQQFLDEMGKNGALDREAECWPIAGFDHASERRKMDNWLTQRVRFMNSVVNQMPEKDAGEVVVWSSYITDRGTIRRYATLQQRLGYDQDATISVSQSVLCSQMGIQERDFQAERLRIVPLNADGSVGSNTAGREYGAWFDARGNTVAWGSNSYMFLEGDTPLSLNIGLHPDNARVGAVYQATLQFQYALSATQTLGVKLVVSATVE